MKPLKLILRAFGPYAGEQAIDFRDLGGRSFFLIHGPTGSGKTSVLDAICFALYGDTSGGERDAARVRSDHAGPETVTEVVFDFALGSEWYRIQRRPEQERPSLRGQDRLIREPKSAALWKLDPETGAAGTVLADRWSRVTEEVERRLGFKADQFRQVVLLPQGRFRELLMAGSAGREEILEVLFQTENYRRIEETLKEEAQGIRRQVEELRQRKTVILEQAGVESDAALEEKLRELGEELAAARERLESLDVKEHTAQALLDAARDVEKRFAERESAETRWNELRARSGEFAEKRARLERGKRALSLRDIEKNREERIREREAAIREKAAAQKHLDTAIHRKEAAETSLRAEQERGPELDAARREYERLSELPARVRELEEAEDVQRRCATAVADAVAAEKEAAGTHAAHAERAAAMLNEADEASRAALREAACLSDWERAKRVRESGESVALKRQHQRALALEREKALALRESRERELLLTRGEMERLEREWLGGQASVLAHRLVSGEPCPVCGSTAHPAPAAYDGVLPSESEVERARERARQCERELAKASETVLAREMEISRLESEIAPLLDIMGDSRGDDPLALRAREKESKAALDIAVEAGKRLTLLRERIEAEHREEIRAKEVLDRARERLAGAERELAGAVVRADERKARIPDDFRSTPAILNAVSTAKKKYEDMARALDTAKTGLDAASERLAAAKTDALHAERGREEAERRAETAEREFDTRLREAGFADVPEVRAARLTDKDMRSLEEGIREFEAGLAAAEDRAIRARDAVKDLARSPLEPLERELADIRKEKADCGLQTGALAARIAETGKTRDALRTVITEMEDREARYRVIGRIADVANGGGEKQRKLTFQRFVQAALLDDVLIEATRRLRIMSRGRFDLKRASGAGDARKSFGLDLTLYDSYTGTERPVNTFSGGESFLASLSLALGLADVVQAYAGGIRLETMFVDEGFGSLDPEALDLAFRALVDLQKGGRLVGIISHVPELRERIDARLEVIPGRTGSTARFVV